MILNRRAIVMTACLAPGLVGCGPHAQPARPVVPVSLSVAATPSGASVAPGMAGLSYEKAGLAVPLFDAANTPLVTLFRRLGPSVLRVGGNTVETTPWSPSGAGLTPGTVSPPDLARLAGFLRAANWKLIYGVGLANTTPADAAAEAVAAAGALGDRLLGFEIGNEPDLYHANGLRPSTYTYADYRTDWEAAASAIRAAVPQAALTGPAAAFDYGGFTVPFATDEGRAISLLSHHYYRADGQSPTATISLLLSSDPGLRLLLAALTTAASANAVALGARLDEANSFYNGGAPGVSNSFASALWAVGFLFQTARGGLSGVNLHGGGSSPGYTPIADDGTSVVEARPAYLGMCLFTLAGTGQLRDVAISPSAAPIAAWAVTSSTNRSLVVINVDESHDANVSAILEAPASSADLVALTAPSLSATRGALLQGAPVAADGTWKPLPALAVPVSGSTIEFHVQAASAVLVRIH